MSTPPTPPPPARKSRSNLTKLAIAFAISASASGSQHHAQQAQTVQHETSNSPSKRAIIIEALCVVGLIVSFFMAIFKSLVAKVSREPTSAPDREGSSPAPTTMKTKTPPFPIAAALAVILVIGFGVCAANLNIEGDSPPIA